jgi:IclR family acetate operon transcriptional repressor
MAGSGLGRSNGPLPGGKYNLQGLSRALRLLEGLAEAGGEGLSLTEAAQYVETTKSTAFSVLRTLMDFDYVSTVGRAPRYRLGPAVVHLADRYSKSVPWLDIARPIARDLTERTGWTSRVASHVDGHPVFQDRVEAPGMIRFNTELGIRELPHRSAAGKAILACLAEAEVRRIVGETGLPRRTRNTITDVEALLEDLELTRRRGFAVDDEEDDEAVLCIAAAFHSPDTVPLGALSITGLKADMPDWRLHRTGPIVREAADQITRALGGRIRRTTEHVDPEGAAHA